ncbi:MAG: carboxylesterase family protein, partial [Henriciella sp.]
MAGLKLIKGALVAGVFAAMAAAPVAADGHGLPEVTPIVTTAAGDVQGFKDEGVEAYLGLRYAKAPIGELRFEPPVAPDAWEGIYDATSLGAPAMQMYSASGPRTSDFTRQIQTIFPTQGEAKIDNEDALFLNVWTPASDDAKRPVMVWFHGGGYAYGSGGWPAYDGRNLAAKGDVVVVTVNHRLNAFGYMFLGHKFGEDYADTGNLGNLDLIASLEWVRDNIEAFGGDPENVTIMGESGGGSKVSHLLATPAADGLFHKAIIQSGPGVTGVSVDDAVETADLILEKAGIETVEDLKTIPADDLIAAARAADAELDTG